MEKNAVTGAGGVAVLVRVRPIYVYECITLCGLVAKLLNFVPKKLSKLIGVINKGFSYTLSL